MNWTLVFLLFLLIGFCAFEIWGLEGMFAAVDHP